MWTSILSKSTCYYYYMSFVDIPQVRHGSCPESSMIECIRVGVSYEDNNINSFAKIRV